MSIEDQMDNISEKVAFKRYIDEITDEGWAFLIVNDNEGYRWRIYGNGLTSQMLGLIEMAKYEIIKRHEDMST